MSIPRRNPESVQSSFARQRQEYDNQRADYQLTKQSRFVRRRTGLAPQGGSADYHNRNEADYYRGIEIARDMDRNDCVIGQTIDRAVSNIVGEGFTLDPKTGDAGADLAIWDMWQAWTHDADACDVAGEMCFHDFETAAQRSALLDGDSLISGTADGPMQFFEAHCIGTNQRKPDTVLGVTQDEFRKRLKYYVTADLIDPFSTGVHKFGGVENGLDVRDENGVRQLFHVYHPKRTTLTRGVTALAPVVSLAGMFEDINFAELLKRQIVSCFVIFRQQGFSPSGGPAPSTAAGYGASSTETTTEGVRQIEGIAPGIQLTGKPGETFNGFSPDIPGSSFFEHVRLILQLIGVNLGMPIVLALMDTQGTTFHGYRGAVDEARRGFRSNQRTMIKKFHKPCYLWKLNHFLAEDPALREVAKKSTVNITGHKWNPATWPYIEPVKDAQGDLLRVRNGLISPRRLHAERGRDWEEIAEETIEDNAYAITKAKQAAAKINAANDDGNPVHWRELIALPTPDGIQVALGQPAGQPTGQPNAEE